MQILFFICAAGAIAAVPIQFLSVEHLKFEARYGKEKGAKISESLGLLSGYLLFFALIGVWLSPQPRFVTPILPETSVAVASFSIPLVHLIVAIPLILVGVWLLTSSVTGLTIKVSESHKPEKVITSGIYASVRHPQYLGWLSTHIGFTVLLSAWHSLLFTPFVVGLLYLIARKEEEELAREFSSD